MKALTFNLELNDLGSEDFFEHSEKLLSFVGPVPTTVDTDDDIFIAP